MDWAETGGVDGGALHESRKGFIRQIAWPDFYGHLLAAFPELATESFDERYRGVRWRNDPDEIAAWKEGRTGFPLVDAAMRQLVAEGEMHNRARIIVASFLVKDLLVDWRVGERFFRHHLIDGDVAQNVGNWQWVAGTGTDAAPYFRVFNPVSQSERFDPSGTYIGAGSRTRRGTRRLDPCSLGVRSTRVDVLRRGTGKRISRAHSRPHHGKRTSNRRLRGGTKIAVERRPFEISVCEPQLKLVKVGIKRRLLTVTSRPNRQELSPRPSGAPVTSAASQTLSRW